MNLCKINIKDIIISFLENLNPNNYLSLYLAIISVATSKKVSKTIKIAGIDKMNNGKNHYTSRALIIDQQTSNKGLDSGLLGL